MTEKVVYQKYLAKMRALCAKVKTPDKLPFMWGSKETTDFCEEYSDYGLCFVFIACKMNPNAFYGMARVKAGEITLKDFETKVIPIVNGREAEVKQ